MSNHLNSFLFSKATLTSVGLVNSKDAQITQISVENDYDIDTRTNAQGLQINYDPNIELNQGVIFTLTAAKTGVQYPKTVKLFLRACGKPMTLNTKAQIEAGNVLGNQCHLFA